MIAKARFFDPIESAEIAPVSAGNDALHGVFVLNNNGSVRFCNGTLLRWLGASLPEIIGKPIADFLPELSLDNGPRAESKLSSVPQPRAAGRRMLYLHRLDGSKRWVDIDVQVLAQQTEQPLVILVDRAAPRDGKRSMHDLKLSAMLSADAIAITDKNGGFEFVNDAFEAATGYRNDELRGRNWLQLLLEPIAHSSFAEMAAALDARGARRSVAVYRKKNNAALRLQQSVRRFVDANDATTHWVFTGHDARDSSDALPRDQESAYCDKLTGLPGPALACDRMQQLIKYAARNGTSFAIVLLDIEHFESIGADFGYDATNNILRILATRMQHSLRNHDTVSRLNSDRFLLLLCDVDQPIDALNALEKVRAACAIDIPLSDRTVNIALHIGSAIYPLDGEHQQRLLERAEAALLRSKGGNAALRAIAQ